MNEMIQLICEQAEITFCEERVPETGFEYEGAMLTREDLERFAGFIVHECAAFITAWEQYQIDMVNATNGCCNIPTGGGDKLKEHFGVEE